MRKKLAAIAIVAVVGLAGTAAFAYWTTSGFGSGSADAAPGQINNLKFDTTELNAMFPGDSSQTLTVKVTNTATQNAYVASVKAYLEVTKATGAPAGACDPSDFRLNSNPAPGLLDTHATLTWTPVDLAPNGFANATGTIQFNNKAGVNQDGCKDASVTLHYLAS